MNIHPNLISVKDTLNEIYQTHFSYGTLRGIFIIDDTLLKQICDTYYFKSYGLVEKKTEYYKLMFDFDFKEKHGGYNTYAHNSDQIVDHMIKIINKILTSIFDQPDIRFIYCDKNIGKGIHLYYPNIIVSQPIHQYIYNVAYDKLIKNGKFNLTLESWNDIFDKCVFKNVGLRLPYFIINGGYYKPNESKSTYPIPDNKYDIIKLCSIRTDNIEPNPKPTIEIKEDMPKKLTKLKSKLKTHITDMVEKPLEKPKIEYIKISELESILDCFPEYYFIEYHEWNTMGFHIYNCNNTEEACKLFHEKSKVDKHINISYDEIKKKFDGYKIIYYYDPNILRYQARKINPKKFDTIQLNIPYDKQYYQTIKFESPKIVNIDKDKPETFIESVLKKFFENKQFKFFMLLGAYGIGKTTMEEQVCSGNRYERILFITHRQSLAMNFMKNFEELGFYNYLNKANFKASHNRLIVNIDSLHLLKSEFDYFSGESKIEQFDLLILDEICSLLNHFESPLMKNKEGMYNIFHHLIAKSPKVICCDGDISNREFEYIKRFDQEVVIYENTFIPRKYNYIFHYNEFSFINLIENDLQNKMNVVFVSMSASTCNKLEKHFKDKYNTLCITAGSDDKIKKYLINIESMIIEKNIQLLIYSPSVTVGIDISMKDYFSKIYGYMSNNSVSARDFCQMLNRVRNPISNEINIQIDRTISRSQIANYYDFDEIKTKTCDERAYNINDLTTYETLRLWNRFEEINNDNYLFPVFLHLIKKKGHSYVILDEPKKTEFDKSSVKNIILAENIEYEDYCELLNKQKANELTKADKLSIEKFMYAYTFKVSVENIDETFMKTHFGKRHIVKNNELFMNIFNNKEIIIEKTYDNDVKKHKMVHIKKLLHYFGFDKLEKQINKKEFEDKYSKVNEIIDDKFRLLFGMKKEEVDKLVTINNTNKKILGFMNSLIGDYGVEIQSVSGNFYKNEKRIKSITHYTINIIDIIKNIPKNTIGYELYE